jgi:hypothetical protein
MSQALGRLEGEHNLNSAMSISVKPKKRGRPATGRDPLIGVRMPSALTEAIDAWREMQDDPPPSRSEAIRHIPTDHLKAKGLLPK